MSDSDLDALTWGDFEQKYEEEAGALPAVLRFPEDDISVDISPRPVRTIFSVVCATYKVMFVIFAQMNSSLPNQIYDPFAKATISILAAPYTTVVHRYKSYGWKKTSTTGVVGVGGPRNSVALSNIHIHEFDVGLVNLLLFIYTSTSVD